jgi:hypothetical protein
LSPRAPNFRGRSGEIPEPMVSELTHTPKPIGWFGVLLRKSRRKKINLKIYPKTIFGFLIKGEACLIPFRKF